MKKIYIHNFLLMALIVQAWVLGAQNEVFNSLYVAQTHNKIQSQYQDTTTKWSSFVKRLEKFTRLSEQQLTQHDTWIENAHPFQPDFFNISSRGSFKPFAQKIMVPIGSNIAFFGDLHGNKDALINILQYLVRHGYIDNDLRIIKDNFYLVFLGDYVDRGDNGVEVIDILLRLKIANPDNVFLVRGNHEDCDLNTHYGFRDELRLKFPHITEEHINQVYKIYDFMPPMLFIGCGSELQANFAYCCHGGIELGCRFKELLSAPGIHRFQAIKRLDRVNGIRVLHSSLKQAVLQHIPSSEIIDCIPLTPTTPVTFGPMWNDFMTDSGVVDYAQGRGWKCGQALTQHFCKSNSSNNAKLNCIFRAHQHSGDMLTLLKKNKGIVSLWDGMVHTFLAAPLPGVSFPYQSLGILTTAARYEDWVLTHVVIA